MSPSEFKEPVVNWQDSRLRVVINEEEQYSIWPEQRDIPAGWRDGGVSGTKDECLEYIATTWVDMRPLSVRRGMKAAGERV